MINSDSLARTEQAEKLLRVFGNDCESPYVLLAVGNPRECERILCELFELNHEGILSA